MNSSETMLTKVNFLLSTKLFIGSTSKTDACDSYVLNAVFDTIFGPFLAIRLLINIQYLTANQSCCSNTGTRVLVQDYGQRLTLLSAIEVWSLQCFVWWLCVILSRVVALGTLVFLYQVGSAGIEIVQAIHYIFKPFSIEVKQTLVIIVLPIVLDSIQFLGKQYIHSRVTASILHFLQFTE